ncbi:MAG: hypothetical protein INQ03_06430 [Candidatus Heimdallarchaeota archaeon]|nr:hypothetical protein [Candidatus Heimdallarchaeota archaeon]
MVNLKLWANILKIRFKKILGKNKPIILEPRKKVELYLRKYGEELQSLSIDLDNAISSDKIHAESKEIGYLLRKEITEFMELNLMANSEQRIRNMMTSLLVSTDYAILINNQMKYLNEKIKVYLQTAIREAN